METNQNTERRTERKSLIDYVMNQNTEIETAHPSIQDRLFLWKREDETCRHSTPYYK